MLLKAEVLETRLAIQYWHGFNKLSLTKRTGAVTLSLSKGCRSDKSFIVYQNLIAKLYELGYREIPKNMKNLLVRTYTMDSVRAMQAKVYDGKTRYASLSWGMFDEAHDIKPTELYNHTVFNTTTKKIDGFTKPDNIYNSYNFDPVVFALNVDPLTSKFPGVSPYAAMANDPINNVDLTGEAPNPIRIAWDYLHRNFIPNTTAAYIIQYATNVGFQPATCNLCRLGRIYQNTVTGSLGLDQNYKPFRPNNNPLRAVQPDIVQSTGLIAINPFDIKKSSHFEFPDAVFTEIKFKSYEDDKGNNAGQLHTMIDVLSEKRGGNIDGEYNANIKASDYGAATLTFITPSNGIISPELIEYATSKNVQLYQRTTEQDAKDPTRLRVGPNIKPLNLVTLSKGQAGLATVGLTGPGQSEPTDWNQK